jgi:hypothetical protein
LAGFIFNDVNEQIAFCQQTFRSAWNFNDVQAGRRNKERRRCLMSLSDYFETNKGKGVLATADSEGKVNAAIYARPHFMEDGTLAFIMRDRLTHSNLQSNPHAHYLFIENGPGYKGKRLYLKKVREERETELLYELKRRDNNGEKDEKKEEMFLVFFELDRELPLVTPKKERVATEA